MLSVASAGICKRGHVGALRVSARLRHSVCRRQRLLEDSACMKTAPPTGRGLMPACAYAHFFQREHSAPLRQRRLPAAPACWPSQGEAVIKFHPLHWGDPPLVHGYHMGSVAHPLYWGGADSAPGVDANVKEAPTPGCGLAVVTWAIIEDIAPSVLG